MFSGPVLIGRGLNYCNLKMTMSVSIYLILPFVFSILGHYSEGGTPVLIPNTAVKSFSAYGTAGLPWWESWSWPRIVNIPT